MEVIKFGASITLLAVAVTAYCQGLVWVARRGPFAQAAITVVFPVCLMPFIDVHDMMTDRLVVLESSFNMFALVLAFGDRFKRPAMVKASRYLFMLFFAAQVLGFVYAQISKGRYLMVVPSLCMGIGLIRAFRAGGTPKVDSEGRALIFGVTTPVELRWMYVFWVLGVIFVEYQQILPKLVVATIHLCSVAVAFRSGEFFHARILTASHLFLWNFKLSYVHDLLFLGSDFAVLPTSTPTQSIVTLASAVAVIGCVAVLVRWKSRVTGASEPGA